jgi:demethylmenaquinone methyltransferase/2-methoxy-6-polyprenyl-1,4-benzoquinol methylase
MFGRIAPWYDLLNHCLSLGLDFHWRAELVRSTGLQGGARLLDLAAGTMDVCRAVQRHNPEVATLAADLSVPMLQRGRRKVRPDRTLPLCADAGCLPLPDASMDCVTVAFGIRNIRPRSAAYGEILRVLAPGGRLCILEFGTARQRIWGGAYNAYLSGFLPAVGRLLSRDEEAYDYLARTIREFPPAGELRDELLEAGFARVEHRPLTSGIVYLHVADRAR